MRRSELSTSLAVGIREYRRTPVLLAIIVVGPVYLVGLFGVLAPTTPVPVDVPGTSSTVAPLADAIATLGVVLAPAIVCGIVGLYIVDGAAEGDGRLVVAGFSPASLVIARGALVALAAIATALISVGTARLTFDPVSVGMLLVASTLAGLTYGIIGSVVGTLLDRLAGVWVLLFVPLLDLMLFQNPLATESDLLATVLPGRAVMALATDAAFAAGIEWTNLGVAIAYLGLVSVVAIVLYDRTI